MEDYQLTIQEIIEITGGKATGPKTGVIKYIGTDSRALPSSVQLMFVALHGPQRSGIHFIPDAYNKGVRCFLTEKVSGTSRFPDATFIEVKDSLNALQDLARHKRLAFEGRVMAISGSNGKTIVKEWVAELLQQTHPVLRSPRSYNSQIGVPLSVWPLDNTFDFAVIEAGISMKGEMQRLQKLIQPHCGILTNIGEAHGVNFPSDSAKLREKLQLFESAESLIFCSDQLVDGTPLADHLSHLNLKLVDWSTRKKAAYQYELETLEGHTRISIKGVPTGSLLFPFTDDASLENLLHTLTLLQEEGLSFDSLSEGIKGLAPVEMRLETLKGIGNSTLVSDVYNSDITGLDIALNLLDQQRQHTRKVAILSDLFESGMDDRELYVLVNQKLELHGVDLLIAIGEQFKKHDALFSINAHFYRDVEQFLEGIKFRELEQSAILVKGARQYRLEQITDRIQDMHHDTVLEINLSRLVGNLHQFRRKLKPDTAVMVMVKALSYGAGVHEIAATLQEQGVDALAVAYINEGIEIRRAGVELPIMVMNADKSTWLSMIQNRLEPEIFSVEQLKSFIRASGYAGTPNYPVHLKLETGMNRLGLSEVELPEIIELAKNPAVSIRSIFSHLVASDDPMHDDFTHLQASRFMTMAKKIRQETGSEAMLHLLNSSGIVRFPEYHFDMVRLGIGLYGYTEGVSLEPVASFSTVISQLREIGVGETVGYNRSGVAKRSSVIATIPVGYADGIDRRLGNGKFAFLLNGKRAPTIGNICMDMTMLDVTDIASRVGDEVILFGPGIPSQEMADALDTIVYEVLTGIPQRVKRIYIQE